MTCCIARQTPLHRSIAEVDAHRAYATALVGVQYRSKDERNRIMRARIAVTLYKRSTHLLWQTLEAHGRRDGARDPELVAAKRLFNSVARPTASRSSSSKSKSDSALATANAAAAATVNATAAATVNATDRWVPTAISRAEECVRQLERPERVARLLRRAARCLDRRRDVYAEVAYAALFGAMGAIAGPWRSRRNGVGYLRQTVRLLLAAAAAAATKAHPGCVDTLQMTTVFARTSVRLMDTLHAIGARRELLQLAIRDTAPVVGWLEAHVRARQTQQTLDGRATDAASRDGHRLAAQLLGYRRMVAWHRDWRLRGRHQKSVRELAESRALAPIAIVALMPDDDDDDDDDNNADETGDADADADAAIALDASASVSPSSTDAGARVKWPKTASPIVGAFRRSLAENERLLATAASEAAQRVRAAHAVATETPPK